MSRNISEEIAKKLPWVPERIQDPDIIPKGDMPGDKVMFGSMHFEKANLIFPRLLELLMPVLDENPYQRAVVVVCGGSGVGKSGTAFLVSYYLNCMGIGSYTLSGDNYPRRIPKYNDAERLRIFRQSGIKGLVRSGQYVEGRAAILKDLQVIDRDASPEFIIKHPWLSIYQSAGRSGLKNYLGTSDEINFDELSDIVSQFKNGADRIFLKRMGREEAELWYDSVDFSGKSVLVIEWTHGNSHNLQGVDIPILLNSTPQETLEHRRARNRDGAIDSPFTTVVLDIEQEMLMNQASRAKLIVSKSGEILSFADYMKIMIQEM